MPNDYWSPSFSIYSRIACDLTPQLLVGAFVGYYSLGVAYDRGIMMKIDLIAIRFFKPKVGYVGLPLVIPTVQKYAAWGVRVSAAAAAVLIYKLVFKGVVFVYQQITHTNDNKDTKGVAPPGL